MPVLDLNENYLANDPYVGNVRQYFTDKFGVGNIGFYQNYGVTADAEGFYFDGNSYFRFIGDFAYGATENFTFEFWAKWTLSDLTDQNVVWAIPIQWGYKGLDNEWYFTYEYFFYFTSTSKVNLGGLETTATQVTQLNDLVDQWHHIALVREHDPANNQHYLKFFLDGVQFEIDNVSYIPNKVGETAFPNPGTANATPDYALWVGKMQSFNTMSFKGHMKDFRFTKGVARYTSNFTPANYFSKKAFDKLYYGAIEVQKLYKGSDQLYPVPTSILNLSPTLWLDANDSSTLSLTDGLVTTWIDKANGRVLNSVNGNLPLTQSISGFNLNVSAITFTNASGKFLRNTSSLSFKSCYIVLKTTITSLNWDNYYGMFTGNSPDGGGTTIVVDANANTTRIYWGVTPSLFKINNTITDVNGDALTPIKAGCILYCDFPSVRTLPSVAVGTDRDIGGRVFNGFIGEIITYDYSLSEEQINDVYSYLNSKWILS